MFLAGEPNLIAITVANVVALCVLLMISVGCSYKLRMKNLESYILVTMISLVALASIIDPLVFLCDGNTGIIKEASGFHIFVNHFGNSLIFIIDELIVILWSAFLIIHLDGTLSKIRMIVYASIMAICLLALFINIFVPFIFEVDRNSVYSRVGYGYLIFTILDVLILLDSILIYIKIRAKGGILKFFPIWGFLIPSICGMIAQSVVYGISTINVGNAIAAAGMMMSMQNDLIFMDKLTGLYNRSHLDKLKAQMEKSKKNAQYTAMMIDLNGFKLINDNFGHLVGDEALITAAKLLKEAVGSYGTVIRYAGDEFVIILNTISDPLIDEVVLSIRRTFSNYNKKKMAPYELSISLGYSKANLKEQSIDELMNDIDKKMFEDKKKQHKEHPEWERRNQK